VPPSARRPGQEFGDARQLACHIGVETARDAQSLLEYLAPTGCIVVLGQLAAQLVDAVLGLKDRADLEQVEAEQPLELFDAQHPGDLDVVVVARARGFRRVAITSPSSS